jgi:peroxiredoxin
VGVAWTGSDDDFQGFVDTYDLTFPQISDDPGDVYGRFGIPAQPAFVIVTADGSVETLFGAIEPDLLTQAITEAA